MNYRGPLLPIYDRRDEEYKINLKKRDHGSDVVVFYGIMEIMFLAWKK